MCTKHSTTAQCQIVPVNASEKNFTVNFTVGDSSASGTGQLAGGGGQLAGGGGQLEVNVEGVVIWRGCQLM